MSNSEALVFDAIRTPRGRGKVNGSLHTVKPVDLVVGLMHETLVRNERLDPNRVDDVVLGCVSPVGDQGADIAKTAAIKAGLPHDRRRRSAQPLLRVRARGGQHRRAEGRLRLGGPRARRRGRVDVARADGLRRRRLGDGPRDQLRHVFHPAGDQRRPDRDGRGVQPRGRRRVRGALAGARRGRAGRGQVQGVGDPGAATSTSTSCSTSDEFIRPGTTVESLAGLKPSFAAIGDMGGFDAVALQKYHWVEKIDHVHTPGNSSGIVDGAALMVIGNEQTGREQGLQAEGADPRDRGLRR